MDGRERRWCKRVCGCGWQWQVRVCGHGRFGQVLVCGRECYGRYSHAGADVIAKKIVNQKFDFDCVLTFLRGGKRTFYIHSFTSHVNYNSPLLNELHIELQTTLEWKKQKLYISLRKQHSGITMLKGADVNRLKTSEMDSLVCGSLSWRPLKFNSKPWKTVASGSSVLSHSSFQIRLANTPTEYASAALVYRCHVLPICNICHHLFFLLIAI
jgi:hypothetical protein